MEHEILSFMIAYIPMPDSLKHSEFTFFAGSISILLSIINNHHQEIIQLVMSEKQK